METTLKDLLHAINIIGDDFDVTVDGVDAIAVCPPVKITPEGQKYFKEALEATVQVEYHSDDSYWGTYVSNEDDEIDQKAWHFLTSLAGHCDEDDYNKWFEAENAEII